MLGHHMLVPGVLHPKGAAGRGIWRTIGADPEDYSSKSHRRILPQSSVAKLQLEQLEPEAGLIQS